MRRVQSLGQYVSVEARVFRSEPANHHGVGICVKNDPRERRRASRYRFAVGYRPRGRRVRDKAFAVVVAVGLAAALLLPAAPVAGAPATPLPVPPIAWSNCPTNPGFLCASVAVPIDYRAPTRGSLSIAVIERPASTPHPAGQLLFNPGGPGESGVQVLPVFASLAPPPVLNQFDLVSFDERGTGASSKLNCGPTLPVATSAPPTPAAPAAPLPAAAVFASMAASCRAKYPTLFAHVDSIDAARDMDRIRSALGASTISYWGISYGTVLGAQYARLFPARVRSMVLDGAVVPTEALTLQAQQEAPPMATNLQHFFATCAADPACPLNPNPPGPYLAVETQLASNPLPSPADGVPVTDGDLDTAALFYLTVPHFAGDFAHAVAAAGAGDGAPLRSMAVSFSTDIDGSSVLGPLWTYTCNDAADRPGGVAAGRLARALTRSNPPIGRLPPQRRAAAEQLGLLSARSQLGARSAANTTLPITSRGTPRSGNGSGRSGRWARWPLQVLARRPSRVRVSLMRLR